MTIILWNDIIVYLGNIVANDEEELFLLFHSTCIHKI